MPHPLTPRTTVDRYVIEKTFAATAAGIIYLVEDMQLGRRLLMMEFLPASVARRDRENDGNPQRIVADDPKTFEGQKGAFIEEILRLGSREYPGFLKTIRHFEANGTIYAVAQYKNEVPFEAYYHRERTVTDAELHTAFAPLLNLLQSLHNRGEVYKNLCPENLAVRKNGELVLTGFASTVPPVHEGYSPPEQYAKIGAKITPRSDLYALGALLYRIATNNAPAGSRERLKAQIRSEQDPYAPLQPGRCSQALCALVNDALCLDPQKRPASVYAFESVMGAPLPTMQSVTARRQDAEPKKSSPKTSPLRLGIVAAAAAVAYLLMINGGPAVIKAEELSGLDIMRYRWAAMWGDVEAQRALGRIYESGLGVGKDREKAIEWYKKAADQGDYSAMVILDDIRTRETAKSSDGHSSVAWNYSARIKETTEKNPRAVFQMYYDQAQAGSAAGQYNLAYAYSKGIGVPKDEEKASYYLRKAADQGDTESLMWMGSRYFFGTGVRKDEAAAARAFKQAAEKGHVTAMEWLGYMYGSGLGIEKDPKRAVEWHQKAAGAGDKLAAYNLGNCYADGKGVPRDSAKALQWYKRAADAGYRDAAGAIGRVYYRSAARGKSTDVRGDFMRAKQWYLKAEKLGDPTAKSFLSAIEKELRGMTATSVRQSGQPNRGDGTETMQASSSSTVQRQKEQIEEAVGVERERRHGFPGKTYARFIDRGDYVQDTKTGLLWQKDGRASGRRNFYQAGDYAKSLALGGLLGWRVPTRKELASIFPAQRSPFTNTPYTSKPCCKGPYEWRSYWTSELDRRLPDYAYVYQWYGRGGGNNCYASKNYDYVRAVHDPVVNLAYLRTTFGSAW